MSPQKLAISKEPLIMVPEIDASFDQNIRHVINLLVSNEFFDSNVQITPGMAHVINSLMPFNRADGYLAFWFFIFPPIPVISPLLPDSRFL